MLTDENFDFKEKLREALKEHLSVTVEFHKAVAYFDSDTITVKVLFDGEVINETES